MDIIAKTSVRVSPRKVRLVADSIRKQPLEEALRVLAVLEKRGAVSLDKTLKSAIANAVNNNKLTRESLFIKSIEVSEALSYKRFHESTRGRVHPYKRRGSHIRIVLTDNQTQNSNGEAKKETNKKPEKPEKTGNSKKEDKTSK